MRPALFATILIALTPSLFAYPRYNITDLGTLGGGTSEATDINDSGQVVGSAYLANDTARHAFLYTNGTMMDLGTLDGGDSSADAINDAGQVAGTSTNNDHNDSRVFLYSDGVMHGLALTSTNADSLEVGGINSHAAIAVTIHHFDKHSGPSSYVLRDGKIRALNRDLYVVRDIDDRGRVLGEVGYNHPRIDEHGKLTSPGPLGRVPAYPFAMNRRGEIVGSLLVHDEQPIIYRSNKVELMSKHHPGRALDLNDAGVAVGYLDDDYPPQAFIYYGRSTIPLRVFVNFVNEEPPSPGGPFWQLQQATAINNRGEIVGYGLNPKGQRHAFLLTPTTGVLIEGALDPARVVTSTRAVVRGWTFGPVARVTYRIGHGAEKRTMGTTRWHLTARLKHGRNNVRVTATGPDGTSDRMTIIIRRR